MTCSSSGGASSHGTTTTKTTTTMMDTLPDTAAMRRQRIEPFRPVLELLWPDTDLETNSVDADKLVNFFTSRYVWRLVGLANFDADHFKLKRTECDLFESETLVGQLGYICRFISFYGVHNFLALYAKQHDNTTRAIRCIENAVAKHISKHGLYGINGVLDLSPRGLRNLSLMQARRWLTHLLAKLDFWRLPFDERGRETWLTNGALHLLDRFPVLASEKIQADKNFPISTIYPYAYLLWGGFGKDVVAHVVSLYAQALQEDIGNNQHMGFLKAHRARCGFPLPLAVIQTLLDANKTLLQTRDVFGRRGSSFLELLIRHGYGADVLGYTLRDGMIGRDINSLWLVNSDNPPYELNETQVKAIEFVLPCLRYLECRLCWTVRAEAMLLHDIAICCKHNNNLEVLKMTLSPAAFYSEEVTRRTLQQVMTHMNKGLKVVSWNLVDAPQSLVDRRVLYPQHRRIACDVCLTAINNGLFHSRKICLEELTLQGFSLANTTNLEQLINQEEIGCINMQLDSGGDRYNFEMAPLNGRPRIERLNLYQCSLFDIESSPEQNWHELWQTIGLTSGLESLLLHPRHPNIMPEWVLLALDPVSHLQSLRRLELGPHSHIGPNPDDTDCVDITDPLVTLLNVGCIEQIRIHAAVKQYQIHVTEFCETLSRNKSLRCLDLRGTFFEGTNTSQSFLEAMKQSNNVTLDFAALYDDRYFYTPITVDSYRRKPNTFKHYSYEDYEYASQILHLCNSNLCGRGWIQKKTTKVSDLVGLLDNVRPILALGAATTTNQNPKLYRLLATTGLPWSSPEEKLNEIYCVIRKTPMIFTTAAALAHETVSIQYTLLRENPGLWCHAGTGTPGSPRKRQRIV